MKGELTVITIRLKPQNDAEFLELKTQGNLWNGTVHVTGKEKYTYTGSTSWTYLWQMLTARIEDHQKNPNRNNMLSRVAKMTKTVGKGTHMHFDFVTTRQGQKTGGLLVIVSNSDLFWALVRLGPEVAFWNVIKAARKWQLNRKQNQQ